MLYYKDQEFIQQGSGGYTTRIRSLYNKDKEVTSRIFWYRCFYPHRSKDALSHVWGILLVWDDKRMENVWESLGFIMVNLVPREVPLPKTLGHAAPRVLALGLHKGLHSPWYPLGFSTHSPSVVQMLRLPKSSGLLMNEASPHTALEHSVRS